MNKLVKKLGLLFTVILLSLGAVGIADANNNQVQAAKTIRVTYTLKNNKKTIAKKNIRVKYISEEDYAKVHISWW